MSAFDAPRLVSLGRVTAVAPSPDGTWLAVAVSRLLPAEGKYASDLWRVSLLGDSAPVQLTFTDHNHRAPSFRRDGALGFLSDRPPRAGKPEEGDEDRSQVWLFPSEGGDARPITDEPLGVRAFGFARRADRLIVVSDVLVGIPHASQRSHARDVATKGPSALRYDAMPVRYWDHWLAIAAPHVIAYDGNGDARRDLTPTADREHRELEWDVALDGSAVVVTSASPGADRVHDVGLRWIDTTTGTSRMIAREPRTMLGHPRFSPDGASIACVRHVRSRDAFGAHTLCVVDVATGAVRDAARTWDRWPLSVYWSDDGRRILATADDHGHIPVFAIDAVSGEVTRITSDASGGSHGEIATRPGHEEIVGVRHRLTHPPEPFVVAARAHAEPRLVARLSGFDAREGEQLAEISSRATPSTDGTTVQYFLLRPRAIPVSERLPILHFVHGGPRSQWTDGWHWRWNPLVAVADGYVVTLPNPRGSTGFGQAFIEGISVNRWGLHCYEDVLAVADAVAATPGCDGTLSCAMGGSFGGYMTAWIGANTERFKCLITHAGLYSFTAFHGVTDLPAWWLYEMGTNPYDDRDTYERYSPHRNVTRWKSPTLVIHGEKDYRVPVSEALALFEALQHHGVPSELLVFPDEGHWILEPRNSVAWYGAVLEFLQRHLKRVD